MRAKFNSLTIFSKSIRTTGVHLTCNTAEVSLVLAPLVSHTNSLHQFEPSSQVHKFCKGRLWIKHDEKILG